MASTGRIPLWLIATVGGTAALTVVGLFIFGSYSGVGWQYPCAACHTRPAPTLCGGQPAWSEKGEPL